MATSDPFTCMMRLESEALQCKRLHSEPSPDAFCAQRRRSNLLIEHDGITQDVVAVCETLLGTLHEAAAPGDGVPKLRTLHLESVSLRARISTLFALSPWTR